MTETVELRVAMTCQGCVGSVNRVLGRLEGVDKVDIDLAQKKVTVTGNVTREAVKEKVAKTGLSTEYWS
eukprot:CAMPEP_0206137652 /NCGR_PEP_ID=MMETSP1473-20131121/2739_1 /ASSEMBLY_ACC=CAM_ASM_001109 /TAXON_ID=1461547 /ORGANISM="Stichococcus sp, Strain RCC1054" /LENGTH=68 /DNA_ID=CAMNT_0053530841 /DNA_START=169 /DNA_END=375 /DNA_ORIENTATION=+